MLIAAQMKYSVYVCTSFLVPLFIEFHSNDFFFEFGNWVIANNFVFEIESRKCRYVYWLSNSTGRLQIYVLTFEIYLMGSKL